MCAMPGFEIASSKSASLFMAAALLVSTFLFSPPYAVRKFKPLARKTFSTSYSSIYLYSYGYFFVMSLLVSRFFFLPLKEFDNLGYT